MDNASFDRLAASLASGGSRRRVLGGFAAVLGAAVVGERALAVKGGNGKSKGNTGDAPGQNKVGVCHRTGGKDKDKGKGQGGNVSYVYLELPPKAAAAHLRQHGDAIDVDLDTDVANCGECGRVCEAPDACSTATCVAGECSSTPVVCPDDSNECTTATCDATTGGCVTSDIADGTECSIGTCVAGECASLVE